MTTKRFWLHFPLGIIFSLLTFAHPVITLVCVYLFDRYERNEDRHLKDQAWKDEGGALAGMIFGGFIYWLFDGIL